MAAREPSLVPSMGLCNVPGKKTMHVEIVYGASGPSTAWGRDIVGVKNNGTGAIQVSFPRPFRKVVGFQAHWVKLASGLALDTVILDNAAIATANSDGTATLSLETRNTSGTATNPLNGAVLSLQFDLSLDVLNDNYPVTVS